MKLTSPSFEHNAAIPAKYTCDGEDINPELRISEVPESAKSLALIMDDPDAPGGTWTHWTIWNIAASKEASLAPPGRDPIIVIKENSIPTGAVEGMTSFKRTGYGGPCPPAGKPHRYFFKLYALDSHLELPAGALVTDLEEGIQKHILAQTELIGLYGR